MPQQVYQAVLDRGISSEGAQGIPNASLPSLQIKIEDDDGRRALQESSAVVPSDPDLAAAAGAEPGSRAARDMAVPSDGDRSAGHIFFRLVSSTPGSKKRPWTDSNLRVASDQVAIHRHDVLRLDGALKEVHVLMQNKSSKRQDAIEMWKQPDTFAQFLRWQVVRTYHTLPFVTLPAAAEAALSALFCAQDTAHEGGAAMATGVPDYDKILPGLQFLDKADVICKLSESGRIVTWKLVWRIWQLLLLQLALYQGLQAFKTFLLQT